MQFRDWEWNSRAVWATPPILRVDNYRIYRCNYNKCFNNRTQVWPMRGVFISHGLRLEMILVMERNFIYIAEALVIYHIINTWRLSCRVMWSVTGVSGHWSVSLQISSISHCIINCVNLETLSSLRSLCLAATAPVHNNSTHIIELAGELTYRVNLTTNIYPVWHVWHVTPCQIPESHPGHSGRH